MSDPTTGRNIECLLHLLTAVSSLAQYGVDEHLRADAVALQGRRRGRDSPAFRLVLSSLNQGPFDERFKFRIACLVAAT